MDGLMRCNQGAKCPNSREYTGPSEALQHDSFEDMYYCHRCNTFFEPYELMKPAMLDPGYKHL